MTPREPIVPPPARAGTGVSRAATRLPFPRDGRPEVDHEEAIKGTAEAGGGCGRAGGGSGGPAPRVNTVRPLASMDFVIVDVETTGWLPEEAGITEIGAVRIGDGRPPIEFSALVNPGHPIPADITALTGITDAMVSQAPPIGAVLPGFLAFARGCVLTAHNAPFDLGFLTAACGSCRIPWPTFPVLDTATLARSVLDETEVPDCKLATLAGFFDARTRPCHRALADAKATADVLKGLLARLAATGVHTLAEITS